MTARGGQAQRAENFRRLHAGQQPLLLANVWDAASAHMVASAGASAVATSSGAVSWAHGVPGGHDLRLDTVPPLTVLFCGVNAPTLAVSSGVPFGGPTNRFWPTLHGAGYTPRLVAASEYRELARLGYGITTLVARSTARADELGPAELRAAVPHLADLAARSRPGWIGFLGVSAFRIAFGRPRATFGPQEDLLLADARVWVLPNPSGRNLHWPLPELITEYGLLRAAATRCGRAAPAA
ncbi:MAG TPA: isocitrate lyase/phosphoenolpyruvate mutase family protein [Pseudonocardia sp.]